MFLATLIVSAKYFNDSSPKNKHWTKYCALFTAPEVNLMERQLLFLLDYDLRVEEPELLAAFAPFLGAPSPALEPARIKRFAAVPVEEQQEQQQPAPAAPLAQAHVQPCTPVRRSDYVSAHGLLTPSPTPASRKGAYPSARRPGMATTASFPTFPSNDSLAGELRPLGPRSLGPAHAQYAAATAAGPIRRSAASHHDLAAHLHGTGNDDEMDVLDECLAAYASPDVAGEEGRSPAPTALQAQPPRSSSLMNIFDAGRRLIGSRSSGNLRGEAVAA